MEWKTSDCAVPYPEALAWMQHRAAAIRAGTTPECVWLLEHEACYTAGTSAQSQDLVDARFPVYDTGRGGQYTYHGPGQLVAYTMLDLKKRYAPQVPDVRDYVQRLEQWIIDTLVEFSITGERRGGRVGIWVTMPDGSESKIAALGVRIIKGVSLHGISINVHPDLAHFAGIIPCGIREHGVTSLAAMNKAVSVQQVSAMLQAKFSGLFEQ